MCIEYIKSEIITAFKDVKLKDGIGLWEAQAIDDYENNDAQVIARNKDIKDNWLLLSNEDLFHCDSSLSYFDAQGMLFHIPAFILAELNGKLNIGPILPLTSLAISNPDIFKLLNVNQKRCVVMFLEWCAAQHEYDFDKSDIERALHEYWYKN
ncbi:MAG TPA: hypothetical protein DEO86_06950 [Colwellia sp.]|nr:hypothetical protein [Colwellia sp.]|tara:strand:- start:787 stop:1245 length:459 start_codon:yes stop_codon:yes gene_type:complete